VNRGFRPVEVGVISDRPVEISGTHSNRAALAEDLKTTWFLASDQAR
jgi:hypothetical protein